MLQGDRLVFEAPASPGVAERLATLGGWRNGTHCTVPLARLLDFEDLFGAEGIQKDDGYTRARFRVIFGVDPGEQRARMAALEHENPELQPPGLRVPLYPFQRKAVEFLRRAQRGILGDEPGLGKTLQALGWAVLNGGRTVVICPAGVSGVWQAEVETKCNLSVAIIRGIKPQEIPATDVVVVPISVVHAHKGALQKIAFANLVVDEAHQIKDPTSKRSQAVRELSKGIQRRLFMSGTLLMRSNEDLYSVVSLVHPLMPTAAAFRERYCVIELKEFRHTRRKVPIVVASQRTDELRKRLNPWMVSRRLTEVRADLPELRHQEVGVVLEGEPLARYREAIKTLRDNGHSDVIAREAFADAVRAIQDAKTAEAREMLEELWLNEDRKALVFSQHLAPLDDLGEVKTWNNGYIRLDGSVPSGKRPQLVASFQTDPRIRLALCQLQAAGVGITLDAADTVLMVDPGWVPALVDQAIRRARRVTTVHPVLAVHFVVRDTLDERRWKRMKERRDALGLVHGTDETPLASMSIEDEVYREFSDEIRKNLG